MDIKKIIACITATAAIALPAAVMAADYTSNYDAEDYALKGVNAAGRKTVVITKDNGDITAEDIVYINQSDDAFSESVNFMLLSGIAEGIYRVSFGGGSSTEPEVGYFTIGDVESENELEATAMDTKEYDDGNGNTLYRKGFSVQLDGADSYNRIIVYNGDTAVGAWSLSNAHVITGTGSIDYGIQIYNIPDEATAQSLRITLSE